MRVNARFEGEAEQQINYLAEVTGTGVSDVLRASVRHYYDQMRAQRGGLTHFAAFVGRGRSGHGNIASDYKALLTESWSAKHQGAVYAVHEPVPPYPVGTAAATRMPEPLSSDTMGKRPGKKSVKTPKGRA